MSNKIEITIKWDNKCAAVVFNPKERDRPRPVANAVVSAKARADAGTVTLTLTLEQASVLRALLAQLGGVA